MWRDEIVEQVRAEREKIAAKFRHDPDALFRDLQEEEKKSERPKVSRPPKQLQRHVSTIG